MTTPIIRDGVIGEARIGEWRIGDMEPVVDLRRPYMVEVWTEGMATCLGVPKNITKLGYNMQVNCSGELTIDFPPDDPIWDVMTYGVEIILRTPERVVEVYRNLGLMR